MNFGELKSKIEVCLSESYKKNNLKKDLFVFNELVLKNKNISKIFFLYDECERRVVCRVIAGDEYPIAEPILDFADETQVVPCLFQVALQFCG